MASGPPLSGLEEASWRTPGETKDMCASEASEITLKEDQEPGPLSQTEVWKGWRESKRGRGAGLGAIFLGSSIQSVGVVWLCDH